MTDNTKVQPNTVDSKSRPPEDVKKLENGPIENRSCTDILCCLLFLASIAVMVYLTIIAYTKGDVWRVLAAWDPDSRACGVGDYKDYKYIYFSIPCPDTTILKTYNICVDKCPITTGSTAVDSAGTAMKGLTNTNADYTTNSAYSGLSAACSSPSGTFFYYKSKGYFKRLCFPADDAILSSIKSSLSSVMNTEQITEWLSDVEEAWVMILISVGISFILGVIYMLFVRIFSGMIIWICIMAYFAGMVVLAVFLYGKTGMSSSDVSDSSTSLDMTSNPKQSTSDNKTSYKVIFWIVIGVIAVSLIGLCCLYRNIKLAIAVIKTATVYVVDVPLVMFVPIFFTIITAGWWAFWIVTILNLYSHGFMYKSSNGPWASIDHKYDSSHASRYVPVPDSSEVDKDYRWNCWYFLFGGLWINAFIGATCQFVLASTACIWYFNKQSGLHKPISRSIYRAFRYHFGSIAFGSLILALVQLIRIVLEYINKQMKNSGAKKNKLVSCIVNCLRCYMACFERFIRFLNRQAYIQIALSGRNFCSACKEAIRLVWSNAARVALVQGLGAVFIFLGKIFIVCATVLTSYLVLTRYSYYKENISNPILPCIIIGIISYVIAVIFMSVYGLAIDAILMCFLYDEEMAKGNNNQKPKHCPPTLEEFFKNNEAKKLSLIHI
eukprot:TRINITY_DN220_c0_g1_i3.p1 TRINITY_DN220_c0_g1~~TRINITY_DN220_c0_g1_i3.p1  ORF type:complete len:664 (-),score=98.29 TRINITY_DN220_c0_g1_i3:141-2132(-)